VPRIAREIMETQILSVSPETPLVQVQRLFVEEAIHGAPVVGSDGRVRGVITSADLHRAVLEEHDGPGGQSAYLREVLEFSSPDWSGMPDDFQDRLSQLRAEDFMTADVVSVPPDATVAEVARVISHARVHRVCVVEDDELIGIISTFDLVAVLEKQE
jgi:CBS domain-containing protein